MLPGEAEVAVWESLLGSSEVTGGQEPDVLGWGGNRCVGGRKF